MNQSLAPKLRRLFFAEFGDFVQKTLLDFGLHLDTVELFDQLQFVTTSRGE
jgi:hypothetical protein